MVNVNTLKSSVETLSHNNFMRFSEFIYADYGIKLPVSKKTMLESRLQKRLRLLGMNSINEYTDYVFSPEGAEGEMAHMVDLVTTNKTQFFREPGCFDYLLKTGLPDLVSMHGAGIKRELRVWSAGCSSGEEPYTLAMVLKKFIEKYPAFCFSILATDLSTRMLKVAIRAVYEQEKIGPVPAAKRKKYFMMSRDKDKRMVRVVPELRSLIKFKRLNLMDKVFSIGEPMDVIFCRNVIIYFDRKTQEKLLNRFCRHLAKDGCIVLGHSEILLDMDVPLVRVSSTVYRKSK